MRAVAALWGLTLLALLQWGSSTAGADGSMPATERNAVGGIACVPVWESPQLRKKMGPAPFSYGVDAVGRPGVPRLTKNQVGVLTRLKRSGPHHHLRFAFVSSEFIVFDASDGPCSTKWYRVLNGYPNEVYQPGESPYGTHAG